MVREFKLPDVGEGVAEGEIVSWLVEPGEEVSEDRPVAEVETDKAVVEVPSPVDGSVQELHAEAGAVVPVGEVIVTFAVEGEDDGEAASDADVPAEGATEPETAGTATTANEADASGAEASGDGRATAETADAESASGGGGRVFAAPSARRLARELDVDIGSVEGSGSAGRVVDGDVRTAANGQRERRESASGMATGDRGPAAGSASGAVEEPADAAAGETSTDSADSAEASIDSAEASASASADEAASVEAADRDRTLAVPATRRVAREMDVDLNRVPATEQRNGEAFVTTEAVEGYARSQQEAQQADARAVSAAGATEAAAEGDEADAGGAATATGERAGERVPYRGIRRTIGQAMERSVYTAPHVTHHDTVDASGLVETREQLKPVAADRGISLTYMPLVMKACVAALREFPYLNSSLDEDAEEIVLRDEYNLGVAVGTDAGLIVPVVDGVDRKGLLGIASDANELIEKAQDRSILREEMQGGTFTITNFGAVGGEYATPIINYPETAILGLGAIEERPVAMNGEVVARPTLPLSLSIDHRVVDGAMVAEFANRLGEYLEEPRLLLLD